MGLGSRQDTHSSPGRVRRSIPMSSPRRSAKPTSRKTCSPSGQRIDAEISQRSRGGNSAGQLIENNREAHWPRATLIVRAKYEARVGGGRRARWLLHIDRGVPGCAGPGLRNREHEFWSPGRQLRHRPGVLRYPVDPNRVLKGRYIERERVAKVVGGRGKMPPSPIYALPSRDRPMCEPVRTLSLIVCMMVLPWSLKNCRTLCESIADTLKFVA